MPVARCAESAIKHQPTNFQVSGHWPHTSQRLQNLTWKKNTQSDANTADWL